MDEEKRKNLSKKNEILEEGDKELVLEGDDRKNENNKIKNNKKIWVSLGGLVCIIVLCIIAINSVVLKYERVVYPGVSIYNEDLSKLNKDQLDKRLYQLKEIINNNTINIEANKKKYTVKIRDLALDYNLKEISDEIISYKKDKNLFERFIAIIINSEKQFKFNISINEEKSKKIEEKIAKDTNVKLKEPKVIIDETNINYIDGKNGLELEKDFIIKEINKKLKETNILNDSINVKLKYKKQTPKISMSDIKKIDYKISTFTTTYEAGGGRSENVENAANKIDNILLMPGEEFSYEKYIGPVILSNGYTYAPVINNGELKPGIGGGVCQVSSTLYNTTLKAGIIPTERRNHSKPVHYVPRGLDATLASGSIDYKFKNTHKYPIVINTKSKGGVLTVEFWSNENALNGIEYKPVSYVRGNGANTYLYGYDKVGNKVYEKHIDTSIYR